MSEACPFTGLRPFTGDSKEDAFAVVRKLYHGHECAMLEKYLRNPLREYECSVGDIAYYAGKPVGFQAAILRRLYFRQRPILGVVGGMLAMESGESGGGPVLLMNLLKATMGLRGGRLIYFANTANVASMKMNRLLGVKGRGPASCEQNRFAVIHPLVFAWYLFRRKVLKRKVADSYPCQLEFADFAMERGAFRIKRLCDLDAKKFDSFWKRYLRQNEGLVVSRTPQELEWIFGERLSSGKLVLLTAEAAGEMAGYILLEPSGAGVGISRWRILDLIAVRNASDVLAALIEGAKFFLKRHTPAMVLESFGFGATGLSVLDRKLPHVRKLTNNYFLYKAFDPEIEQAINSNNSWFFGPYDGDMCM